MAENKYDTLIVGAGMAGLTAAAYLSRAGQKVLLIEKNNECGGLVSTFTRHGFQFDAGLRAMEDAGIIFPMLNDLGIQLEFVKSPVSVGIENDILDIEKIEHLKDYQNLLTKFYPESKDEINELLRVIRLVMKNMDVLYGIENPIFKDLMHDRDYLFKKLLPWLPKFLFTIGKINRMNMPVEEYLDTFINNSSLKDIIAQHFFKSTPTFFALSYFSLYLDYFYPVGGTGKIPEALTQKILDWGGEIKTKTTITEVFADEKQVLDAKNISYSYKNLIWAADLKTLYKIVKTADFSSSVRNNIEKEKNKLFKERGSDSVFTLYLEVDEPIESFKEISNGHFFYTPLKQGLGETHRKELSTMLDNWSSIEKTQLWAWLDKFTQLNTYEISIPCSKDPSMAPEGKTGLIVSLLAEYNLFKKVEESGWYNEFKTELETRMIEVLSNSIYPMLKTKIIGQFSFSPLSIQNRVGSSEGSIIGWSFERPVPAIHKIQMVNSSIRTPIPSIFQAGQWTYSPGGVPMSILTGKLAADKVLKKN